MVRDRFRWVIVALIFVITVINYIDRSAISYAAPDISAALGLTSAQLGLILGAFGLGYFFTTLLGGVLTDRYGAKIVLGGAALVWTISIGFNGLAVGFVMLYAARVGLGIAEGPGFPALTGAISRWLPSDERATALAGTLVAVPISLAIGAPLVSFLVSEAGWRVTFFILAALGFLWLPLWLWLFHDDPERSPHVSEREKARIREGQEPASTRAEAMSIPQQLRTTLSSKTLLANNFAFFVMGYYLFFFLTWMPSYLHHKYDLKIITVGFLAAIPWITSALMMVLVSRWCDRELTRTGSLRRSRSYPIALSQIVAALAVVPVAMVDDLLVAMVGLTVAVAATLAANATYFAVNIDITPRHAATSLGVMDLCFALAGFLAPVITGFVFHATGSFSSAFFIMAGLAMSSVALVLLAHHPDREVADAGAVDARPAR